MGAYKQMLIEEIEEQEKKSDLIHRLSKGRTPQRMVNQYENDLVGNAPTEDELKNGAMSASIPDLVDMWVIRFGDEWVSEDIIKEDRFWVLALLRLYGVDRVEKMQLFNQFKSVYKVIK
jgi:hypothetical protein